MPPNSRLAVAAHILAVLATRRGRWVASGEVARSVNTNPVVIRRLLAALARGGLVECRTGQAGGSRLSRPPERISLWDLSRALGEERLFAVHRNPENPGCPVSCRMKDALGRAFAGAERAARDRLKAISVRDLLGS